MQAAALADHVSMAAAGRCTRISLPYLLEELAVVQAMPGRLALQYSSSSAAARKQGQVGRS
jgi:hypothetical protein